MREYRKKRFSLRFKIITSILLVMLALFAAAWYVRVIANESIKSSKEQLSTGLVSLNRAITDDKLSTDDKTSSLSNYLKELDKIKADLCYQDKNDTLSATLRLTNGCTDKIAALNKVIVTTRLLSQAVQDDSYLSGILSQVAASDSIHDLAVYWVDTAKQFSEYEVVSNLKEEKQKLSSVIDSHADYWKALDEADNNKDETAFKSARDGIYATHAQIIKYKEIFHDQVTGIVKSLNEQIGLFNS